ncbi:MAG: hypothetical protein AB8G11_16795 [Saprospiraceae bacterium]
MSSLKILEITGSIGLISGITLTIFFFLFNSIFHKDILDLSRVSVKRTLALMLMSVWIVTVTSFTLWIYNNSVTHEGGEQPTIKDVEIVEQPAAEISKSENIAQLALHSSVINIMGKEPMLLVKNPTFFNPENIDNDEICGLKVRSSIWLSFNNNQPYYRQFQDEKVKVILKRIDTEKNEATFVMQLREEGKVMKLHNFSLSKNDFYNFEYNGCEYNFYYRGKTASTTGIKYWFQTRYSAHFAIEPIEV